MLMQIIFTQLNGIKYSNEMPMIFKWIYLTRRWELNRFYLSRSEWTWE